VPAAMLHNLTTGEDYRLKPLGDVAPILEAGGLFPYAKKVGMLGASTTAQATTTE
jgi:3-isopropylmalate/(R)-2-methylmalate dehydratase small subunit